MIVKTRVNPEDLNAGDVTADHFAQLSELSGPLAQVYDGRRHRTRLYKCAPNCNF